jgi:SHS2 domain-containing protein
VAAGHRIVPHTADVALEAWAPSRNACIAEAVRALAESYTSARPDEASGTVTAAVRACTGPDLLVAVLNEAIFVAEVRGEVPVDASVDDAGGCTGAGAIIRFACVPAAGVDVVGAVPKAVSLHELEFGPDSSGGWRCHVTVDV